MERDDMHVVVCRVLDYLYGCMKAGTEPDNAMWDAAAMGIPESYWNAIVTELVEHGYIKGVMFAGGGMAVPARPQITLTGVSYAQSDALVVKAREWLSEEGLVG